LKVDQNHQDPQFTFWIFFNLHWALFS